MSFGKTVNLGNSIIGVSILAMPYCFVRSGLLLSIVLLILSALLTRLSCYLLLKSAFLLRRRNFELIVQDVLGPGGRIMAEVGLIGFLLGTCVAYFIMIGDLAPKIMVELLNIDTDYNLRTICVLILALFVALPLSLLKRVDSLTSCSLLSMLLYSFLIIKLLFETNSKLMNSSTGLTYEDTYDKIVYWNISGLLTTFPIFCMAMSCQTSLFEIFDASFACSETDTIKRDTGIITKAIYLCLFAYTTVGLLGSVAFHDRELHGNLLIAFEPSLTTTLTKIGFIVTLLLSFPLCVFPCRTSVYSLTIGKMNKTTQFQQVATSATTIGMNNFMSHDNQKDATNCQDYRDDSNIKQLDNKCDNIDDKKHNLIINNNSSKYNTVDQDLYNVNNAPPINKQSFLDSSHMTATNRFTINHQNSTSKLPYKSLLEDCDISMEECDDMSFNTMTNDGDISNNELKDKEIGSIGPSRLYISDFHFRLLTVLLIGVTSTLSLIFPHIEFILGIIGSTVGTTVCFILPAYTFIRIGRHTKTETLLARTLLLIGLAILIFCTYSTLHSIKI